MTEQTTHIRIPVKSKKQLEKLAELEQQRRPHGRVSLTEQIAVVVENAYRATFDVVAIDELPRPEGAESIPVVYVATPGLISMRKEKK